MIVVLYNLDTQRIISHPTEQSELNKPTSISCVELEYINTPQPVYDPSTEVISSVWTTDLVDFEYRLDWSIRDKTEQELINDVNTQADIANSTLDPIETKLALQLTVDALPEEEQVLYTSVYAAYKVGKAYIINDKFQYENLLYKVIQAHTSQLDWKPNEVPALYVEVNAPDVIPVWKQPIGASDAYNIGDKVHFPLITDPVYESKINDNVWSPTAYPAGWKLI